MEVRTHWLMGMKSMLSYCSHINFLTLRLLARECLNKLEYGMAKEDKVSIYINKSYHVGDTNFVSLFVFSCPFVLDSDQLSADSNVQLLKLYFHGFVWVY